MPEITGLAENVAKNLEKMVGVDGLLAGWVSWVLERGVPKPTRRHRVFDVRTQVQLPNPLDREVSSRVRAGRVGLEGQLTL